MSRKDAELNEALLRWSRSLSKARIGGFPVLDLGVAVFLSAYAVVLTSGAVDTGHPTGGLGASLAVLAMTLPVAWCRRAPLPAAAVLAAGALFNGLVFGSLVRCGAALPATFIVAFFVAARNDRKRAAVGLAFCAVNVTVQALYDPQLGARALALLLPILGLFAAIGRIVRSRTAAVEALRSQTEELRRRREQTARVSVLADRARVSADLDNMLRHRIQHIATVAATARETFAADPQATFEALLGIEQEGREVLRQMRELVGSLDEGPPNTPQPSLAELPALLARATSADARLSFEGDRRRLPAGIELAGYRIAEHLVAALEDLPGATVDICLRFSPEALELDVSGPPATGLEPAGVLAAARERAALHDGSVDERVIAGRRHATARIPLVTSYG
jgi:Histidine kinase